MPIFSTLFAIKDDECHQCCVMGGRVAVGVGSSRDVLASGLFLYIVQQWLLATDRDLITVGLSLSLHP